MTGAFLCRRKVTVAWFNVLCACVATLLGNEGCAWQSPAHDWKLDLILKRRISPDIEWPIFQKLIGTIDARSSLGRLLQRST